MTEPALSFGRRLRNAAVPAIVFGLSLVLAGLALWYWRDSVGDADRGRALFERMCFLGLSIALAALICRMLAGARSARLGLLKPEAGDLGALGWFAVLFAWGVAKAPAAKADASLVDKCVLWLRVGLVESPLYVVFGLALVGTVVFALIDIAMRRAFAK